MSLVNSGYLSTIGYVQETTYGVAPSSASFSVLAIATAEPNLNGNYIPIYALGQRAAYFVLRGRREVEVRQEFYPQDKTAISIPISSYTNSYTLWCQYININANLTLVGAKAEEITLVGRVGEPLRATVSWYCKDVTSSAPTGGTMGTVSTKTPYHFDRQSITYSGSALTAATDFECRIRNNLERIWQFNDVSIRAAPEKNVEITGTVRVTLGSTGQITDFLSDTYFDMDITLGVDSVTTSPTVLKLYRCKWERVPIPQSPTDIIALALPYRASSVSIIG